MKSPIFLLCGVLCGATVPVWAQSQTKPQTAPGPAFKSVAARESGISLATLLQLQPAQIERLNRLSDDWASRRAAQESKIAGLQNQLAQSPSDARRLARLQNDLDGARRKNSGDFAATRAKAREVLPPVQRSQLDAFAGDPRFRLRRDSFYGLLVAPWEEMNAPQDSSAEARRNWLDARARAGRDDRNFKNAQGVGNVGVYGGYGYGGPQAGVYGGYHQGGVGVHAGIGLGGPSIGINVGRVFGARRR